MTRSETGGVFGEGLELGSLRGYLDRSDDLFTIVDRDARFLHVNSASRIFFGLEPEECVGRSAFDFVHPGDVERTKADFPKWAERTPTGSRIHENRQVNPSTGEVFHVMWTIVPEHDERGELLRYISSARDITELRDVERELAGRELYLRSLLAGMLDAVITIDPFGLVREASDSVREIFGYRPEELVGSNIKVLMPEPHRANHDEYLARYRVTGDTWILNTTRVFDCLRKDGERIVCELSVSRIDLPDGEPVFCGSFRDVTARVRADRSLAESERRFRAVFQQEFQYVAILSPDGVLLEVNDAALEVVGAERSDVLGLSYPKTPWWSGEGERERLEAALASARAGELVRFETQLVLPDGRRSIDFSLKPVLDDEGATVLLVAEGRDITVVKRALERETSMLRAFASIGESASVLAHEIKNPITAVNAALRAVATQLGEDEQVILSELVGRMQKLEKLIRRTLSFAKPLDMRPRPRPVANVFRDLRALVSDQTKEEGVALETEVAEACPHVVVDSALFEEVLLNLVRNALEAGARTIRLTAAPENTGIVLVAVDDDGPGITPSVLTSLFEPFVTTKASGTGIGLALSRKIVEQHGGKLRASASDLGGARFEIEIPAARG